jgi:ribosomal protein S18 acetylase RimI-like enzyme
VGEQTIVSVRPLRRDDLAAFAAWGRHADPLFAHYDVRALDARETGALWTALAGEPARRRPYAGLEDDLVVASLMLRIVGPGEGDLGIVLDPNRIGRGLGRRILRAFVAVCIGEGFGRLRLEVAAYNGRAIAAYRAAGFEAVDERWDEPEPGIDVEALLDGPSAAALAPHVRRDGGGYRMRVIRMERRPESPMTGEA